MQSVVDLKCYKTLLKTKDHRVLTHRFLKLSNNVVMVELAGSELANSANSGYKLEVPLSCSSQVPGRET